MKIILTGLNHKTAAVEIREKLAFNDEQVGAALAELKQNFGQGEFALLSTCNRTELYFSAPEEINYEPDEVLGRCAGCGGWILPPFRR